MTMRTRSLIGLIITSLVLCLCGQSFLEAQDKGDSLTIDQAVQTALSDNLTLRNARLDVVAANARIGSARSAGRLQIQGSGQYQRMSEIPEFRLPSPIPIPSPEVAILVQDNITGLIAIRQAVYTGGRVGAKVSIADAQFDAAVARLAAAEAQIALQTRVAYFNVLLRQGLAKSNEENLKAAKEQLDAATARFDAGTAPKFDVLRAQTQVSQAEQDLTQSRNRVETSQIQLNKVLGVPLGKGYVLSEPPEAAPPTKDIASLIEIAESQRAEMLAARAQVAAAESGIRLASSQLLPELDLVANYNMVQRTNPVQITNWTYLVMLSMPLVDGGKAKSDIEEARALRDEAQTNLEDTARLIEQEVRNAYLDVQTAHKDIETAKTRLAQATEAYDVANVRYESGVGTAVEQADAVATLSQARTNLDTARFNYIASYAALQRALGLITY